MKQRHAPQTAAELRELLGLRADPVGIALCERVPAGVEPCPAPMSPAAPDGRRGRAPASCVFWTMAAQVGRPFLTLPEDHGNCSVGRVVHGFAKPSEVAGNEDVMGLVDAGWVDPEELASVPRVSRRPAAIVYGPAEGLPVEPDVVLLRVTPAQATLLAEALPEMSIGAKPQCHVVAAALERGRPAASVGCALSRARTGMGEDEMVVALPARELRATVDRIRKARDAAAQAVRLAQFDGVRSGEDE